ncbi:Calcium-independent phospholipase A2-gamma [Tetrabaena socialis]|uniref:Calcium-independent phospholipase A2-gamma n=1 Tax=Tetrabaena socialis TaxID=47790 RepID=A0A2J7ZQ10_9CHLO|nr:Calcium-independent phospholipase A2-gamma [Tetrabaena socialis]|eukprot:PNH02357.1 Calcium-independent phospholipase A2-gamma [Tetrabaena socialis]
MFSRRVFGGNPDSFKLVLEYGRDDTYVPDHLSGQVRLPVALATVEFEFNSDESEASVLERFTQAKSRIAFERMEERVLLKLAPHEASSSVSSLGASAGAGVGAVGAVDGAVSARGNGGAGVGAKLSVACVSPVLRCVQAVRTSSAGSVPEAVLTALFKHCDQSGVWKLRGAEGFGNFWCRCGGRGHVQREGSGGRPLHSLFDLVVGTSTGAIVAVGLGVLHFSLDQCEAVYTGLGHKVFNQASASGGSAATRDDPASTTAASLSATGPASASSGGAGAAQPPPSAAAAAAASGGGGWRDSLFRVVRGTSTNLRYAVYGCKHDAATFEALLKQMCDVQKLGAPLEARGSCRTYALLARQEVWHGGRPLATLLLQVTRPAALLRPADFAALAPQLYGMVVTAAAPLPPAAVGALLRAGARAVLCPDRPLLPPTPRQLSPEPSLCPLPARQPQPPLAWRDSTSLSGGLPPPPSGSQPPHQPRQQEQQEQQAPGQRCAGEVSDFFRVLVSELVGGGTALGALGEAERRHPALSGRVAFRHL